MCVKNMGTCVLRTNMTAKSNVCVSIQSFVFIAKKAAYVPRGTIIQNSFLEFQSVGIGVEGFVC